MKTFGRLKIFARLITHKDKHGREQAKPVSLLTRYCEESEVDNIVTEFYNFNPALNCFDVYSQFIVEEHNCIPAVPFELERR
jgi:hypothetical protein